MAGIPAASQSGAAMSALSEIDGPTITSAPASSSSAKPRLTACSLPTGSPRA